MSSKISQRLKLFLQVKSNSLNLPKLYKRKALSTRSFEIFVILTPTFGVILLMYCSDWEIFRFAGIKGSDFKDYHTILSYKECLKETNFFDFPTYFSECWTGFNYGLSAILLVGALNYLFGSIAAVGWTTIFLVGILLLNLSFFLGAPDLKGRIFQSLLIISPGILLLYERGNLDSWIFIFSIILVMGYKHVNPLIIFICLFLVTLIKFHILFASLYLVSRLSISRNYKIFMSISMSLATGISLAPMASLIPYNWFLSFGSFMPLVYLDFSLTSINFEFLAPGIRVCIGVIFFTCLTFLARRTSQIFRRLTLLETRARSNENVVLNFFSICYLSSFFLSTNYDYRLIFLVPAIILFDRELLAEKVASKERIFFIALTISSLYLGSTYGAPFFFLQAIQFIGDLGLSLISAILLFRLISNFQASRFKKRLGLTPN